MESHRPDSNPSSFTFQLLSSADGFTFWTCFLICKVGAVVSLSQDWGLVRGPNGTIYLQVWLQVLSNCLPHLSIPSLSPALIFEYGQEWTIGWPSLSLPGMRKDEARRCGLLKGRGGTKLAVRWASSAPLTPRTSYVTLGRLINILCLDFFLCKMGIPVPPSL